MPESDRVYKAGRGAGVRLDAVRRGLSMDSRQAAFFTFPSLRRQGGRS